MRAGVKNAKKEDVFTTKAQRARSSNLEVWLECRAIPEYYENTSFPTFVTSVSLADVAFALLIIFSVCRAKSALW